MSPLKSFFSLLSSLALLGIAGCTTTMTPQAPTLEQQWVLTGLDSPESVIPSADNSFFYVSNVNGEGDAKDANGYISRVATDGTMIEQKWATDLDAPKGLALSGTNLYVTDIDHLDIIDTETGAVYERVEAEGAGFLNDVTVADIGVLIADSANARIYRYADGEMSVWMEDERFGGINGLIAQDDRLLITTMGGGELLSLDWDTKAITALAGGMEDADGMAELADGSFLVSSWPGKLYHIGADGAPNTLLDTAEAPIYMNDFYLMGDTLIVPNWQPGTLRAYKVKL